ncbi:MAG: paraquat-inducible protein A [Ferruginibacter sp.]
MSDKIGNSAYSFRFAKLLLIAGVSIILLIEAWCGYQMYCLSAEQKAHKMDYAFVNNVAYGLFSVDSWRDQLLSAAKEEVKDFRLMPEQDAYLRKEINEIMRAVVDHAFEVINREQTSFRGKLRKFAVKTFVNRGKIDKQVPDMTNNLMKEITRPATYRKLSKAADTALSQIGKAGYDSTVAANQLLMDSIFRIHDVSTRAAFEQKTVSRLTQIKTETYRYVYCILGCIFIILLLWLLLRNQRNLHVSLYLLSVASAMIILTIGLSTTMIEIDARIDKMELHFLDKTISFKDQGLFFQSKSIIEVVILLLKTGRVDSQVVGWLILVFSVLFPFMKLSSTAVALMSEDKWAKNRFIRYFAFESGKWSMADVMVVAFLMTYIGFNGIVASRLETLNYNHIPITSISTTNTMVQPGYIIFLSFVIYGFVLAAILKKISRNFTQL